MPQSNEGSKLIMAQYYANIQGNRGEATRMGTKSSGLHAHVRGWNIGVRVSVSWDEVNKKDIVTIYQTSGSNGHAPDKFLMEYSN
jgi:hypothetical protein